MKSPLPLLILGLSALSACATAPRPEGPHASSAADRHPIAVRETAERVEIPVSPSDATLSPAARERLHAFAANYLRYGRGALLLNAPSGTTNANAASVLATQARSSLMGAGVSYAAVAGATYDAAGVENAPIIVSFARDKERAPECPPIPEQDLAHQSSQPWDSADCARPATLAAMVEDRADLPRPPGASAR
jgi:pilus assembly protein CpaD